MNERNRQEDKWEKIVELCEEGHYLSEEELEQWSNDPEALDVCKELLRCKNAVARRFEKCAPNSEAEWERFHARQKNAASSKKTAPSRLTANHRFLWGITTGVAASFLIVFLYTWYRGYPVHENPYMVFQATESQQQVTLQTSTGKHIALTKVPLKEELHAISTSLDKADSAELIYHDVPVNTQIAIEEKIEMHVLSVPRGQNFKLVLPDGTNVWMNAESRLTYPSRFTGNERFVQLSGEAYFQVTKDHSHPFVVQTDGLQARVLGTELNVRHYVNGEVHVTLINGKVEVCHESEDGAVCLNPGEEATWTENSKWVIKNVDLDPFIYWKEGYFYFDNTPLSAVMKELGRWYNINVIFENKELMDLKIRYFCVRNETLERAVTLLNHMKKIKVSISGNTVYLR